MEHSLRPAREKIAIRSRFFILAKADREFQWAVYMPFDIVPVTLRSNWPVRLLRASMCADVSATARFSVQLNMRVTGQFKCSHLWAVLVAAGC
jgi:hypothetical protein